MAAVLGDEMPFLTAIDLRNDTYNEKNWIVLSVLMYDNKRFGDVDSIPKGFVSDLASVPRVPVAYEMFGGRGNGPAVIHDWNYRTGFRSRVASDLTFLDGMKDINLPWYIREPMYLGVRWGGWITYNRHKKARERGEQPWEIIDVEPYIY